MRVVHTDSVLSQFTVEMPQVDQTDLHIFQQPSSCSVLSYLQLIPILTLLCFWSAFEVQFRCSLQLDNMQCRHPHLNYIQALLSLIRLTAAALNSLLLFPFYHLFCSL